MRDFFLAGNEKSTIFVFTNHHYMTTTNTISRVRNYQGNNTFVIKMKDVIAKYGGLTANQANAVEKCLNAEVKSVDVDSLPENLQVIAKYEGESTFVKDIKDKLMKYGTLTQKQIDAATKSIQKEKDKSETINVKWKTPGETIKIGRKIGQQLKEQYGLKFNPILIDITKILSISPKAVKFTGKLTIKRGDVCTCCMKTLTDEFSMLTGMGKICAGHVGVTYITDKSQAQRFREEYLKRVDEIGELQFWIPKNQIKIWEGKMSQVLELI
jgi:hypothetical protein